MELEDFQIGAKIRLVEDHVGVKRGTIGTVSAYSKKPEAPRLVVEFPSRGLIYCNLDIVEKVE